MTETEAIERRWKKAQKYARALKLQTEALSLRASVLIDARLIAERANIQLPGVAPWLAGVHDISTHDAKIQRMINGVLTGRLGLRSSEAINDIDIMAPPGTRDDELQPFRGFGAWQLIVVGIVIAFGAIAAFMHEHEQAKLYREKYKPLYKKADELLAGNAEWQAKKQEVEFQARKTTWERLESSADKLVSGAKTGLVIAVPLAILVAMSWFKK